MHRQRVCVHALTAGLVRRAERECRDEAARRKSYGSQYIAPGTPGQVVPCRACGITAHLDSEYGLCPECLAEPRWVPVAMEA